jgi:hypothetical protein
MSRPQVTVRRVGRRPTAIRNSDHAPCAGEPSHCHPERSPKGGAEGSVGGQKRADHRPTDPSTRAQWALGRDDTPAEHR